MNCKVCGKFLEAGQHLVLTEANMEKKRYCSAKCFYGDNKNRVDMEQIRIARHKYGDSFIDEAIQSVKASETKEPEQITEPKETTQQKPSQGVKKATPSKKPTTTVKKPVAKK